MGVVLIGAFMVILDITIVNLALPAVKDDLGGSLSVEWIVTCYAVAVGVTQTTSGWVGDRYGRRSAFIAALGAFTVGSALCAVAPSLELLIAARVVQGVGGGLLMPIAMAMVYELFEPEERGTALGILGIAVMAAPAIGPVLGGAVISTIGWRWVFLINVPVGLVGLPLAVRLLRETGFRERRPFDARGLGLVTVGLSALLIGFQQGGQWGWASSATTTALAVAVAALGTFVVHSMHSPAPLVEIRLFANPIFAIAMVVTALAVVGQFGRLVYIPLELGTTRDIDALHIGLVMMPSALGMAMMLPLGGRLTDRVGSRVPFTVGIAILAASFWPLSHLSVDTPLLTIAAVLFVGGLGSGLAMMTPNISAMNSVRASQLAQASGLASATRQVTAGLGTAILAAILAHSVPDVEDLSDPLVVSTAVDAYNNVFRVALVILVVCFAIGFALPGRHRTRELQADRRAESTETPHPLLAD